MDIEKYHKMAYDLSEGKTLSWGDMNKEVHRSRAVASLILDDLVEAGLATVESVPTRTGRKQMVTIKEPGK